MLARALCLLACLFGARAFFLPAGVRLPSALHVGASGDEATQWMSEYLVKVHEARLGEDSQCGLARGRYEQRR